MPSRPTTSSALPTPSLRIPASQSGRRLASPSLALLLALLLAGCAAQNTFTEGKRLVAQDQVEQGLAKFQQAMAEEPKNLQYKAAYMQTRERALASYIYKADTLAAAGKPAEAETHYRRALAIEANNERALAGLEALSIATRHVQLFKDARAAAENKDIHNAQAKLHVILTENPNHEPAAALKRSLAEKTIKPPAETALAAAYKKPISIEFKDAQLKQVFEVIAASSGLNFVFDKEIKTDQKTSIFLRNSTIESAIYMMLITNQLEQQIIDANTILIYPNTSAKQKEYQELVLLQLLAVRLIQGCRSNRQGDRQITRCRHR